MNRGDLFNRAAAAGSIIRLRAIPPNMLMTSKALRSLGGPVVLADGVSLRVSPVPDEDVVSTATSFTASAMSFDDG